MSICLLIKNRQMAYKPTRMDRIKRIIELSTEGYSIKRIGRTIGVSKNTVKKYLRRYELDKEEVFDFYHVYY